MQVEYRIAGSDLIVVRSVGVDIRIADVRRKVFRHSPRAVGIEDADMKDLVSSARYAETAKRPARLVILYDGNVPVVVEQLDIELREIDCIDKRLRDGAILRLELELYAVRSVHEIREHVHRNGRTSGIQDAFSKRNVIAGKAAVDVDGDEATCLGVVPRGIGDGFGLHHECRGQVEPASVRGGIDHRAARVVRDIHTIERRGKTHRTREYRKRRL